MGSAANWGGAGRDARAVFGSQLTRFELALLAFVRLGLNILMKFGLSAHPGSFEPKVRSYLVQTSNSSQPDQTNQKFKINWIDLGQATQKAHKILAKLNPVKKNNLTVLVLEFSPLVNFFHCLIKILYFFQLII